MVSNRPCVMEGYDMGAARVTLLAALWLLGLPMIGCDAGLPNDIRDGRPDRTTDARLGEPDPRVDAAFRGLDAHPCDAARPPSDPVDDSGGLGFDATGDARADAEQARCAVGERCDGPCCADLLTFLVCGEDGHLSIAKRCEAGEACSVEEPAGCVCQPGAARCRSEEAIQSCTDEGRWADEEPCGRGRVCQGDPPACAEGFDECDVGRVRCADRRIVERCERPPSHGLARWTQALDCALESMGRCVLPDDGVVGVPGVGEFRVEQACLNSCGSRATPLLAEPCSPHPDIGCAIWVCSADGLTADHSACRAGGQPCREDNECVSCRCDDNRRCVPGPTRSCDPSCSD